MQSSCICATQSSSFSFAPSFFLCSFHFPASAVLRYMLWRSHVVVLSVAWKCSPMLLQGETVWRSCSERFAGVAADCAPVAHLLLPNKHTHTHTHLFSLERPPLAALSHASIYTSFWIYSTLTPLWKNTPLCSFSPLTLTHSTFDLYSFDFYSCLSPLLLLF